MSSSKDRILDAAETIVLRDGVARLTMDAVAQETQMSKGGVMYHFPSKEDLIRGMIGRMHYLFASEVARLKAKDPCPIGRTLRAMLNTTFPEHPGEVRSRIDRITAALVAAIATNPLLLEGTNAYSHELEAEILNDGLDPVVAMVIHMASDGIWMSQLFGIPHPPGDLRDRVVVRLKEMTLGTEKLGIVDRSFVPG
ncbi:MAG TPA: TetR/AcrR family transcriptional regulator [Bryobacteraceae bacterium]|nr:TetR/AcrR family transcriptional regulator [Bryobacteraceae bacterium]